MKVVVAGGTGWVGSHLCPSLVMSGHELVVLARRPGAPATPGTRFVPWDGRTPGPWTDEIDGADAVVNLSGESIAESRWTPERKARLRASRVEPTTAIVDAIRAARRPPTVLVNASGVGFYGSRGDELLTEASAPGSDFLAQLVVAWEAATLPAAVGGCRAAVLRFGLIFGRDGGGLARLVTPFRWFVGGPIGFHDRWIPWIHVDDAVGLIGLALTHRDAAGPINAVAPEQATYHQLARAIGTAIARPSWVPVPGIALRLVLGELAESILGSQRVVPEVARRLGYSYRHSELRTALAASLEVAA